MASVREVAKQAGVSITTVSRVLNNHPGVSDGARDRVLAAANNAGYVRSVGVRSTTNIAFVYTGESSLGSPFDAALMEGMARGMEEFHYDLMVLDARRSKQPHETYSQMFMRKGVRGAVLRTTAATRDICETIADEGFPCVVVGDRFEGPGVNFIFSDSRESSREAVDHLIGLGHERIAVCTNIVEDSDHADRLAGYKRALQDHGIELDKRLILRIPATRGGGAQLMRRLVTMVPRPTAAFLTDPMTAVGAMNEARRMKVRIPEDLSIVGFDDTELRYSMSPQLTAVCQDACALGREAFSSLYNILDREDGEPIVKKALRTWLEIHESSGPPGEKLNVLNVNEAG